MLDATRMSDMGPTGKGNIKGKAQGNIIITGKGKGTDHIKGKGEGKEKVI